MPASPSTNKRILVIEDDLLLSGSIQRKLRRFGYLTDGCFDGDQGLSRMSEREYDGIVLDLKLPRRDGFDLLAQKAATVNADTPLFVVTSSEPDQCERARQLGARAVFPKLEMSPAAIATALEKNLIAE